VATSGSTNFSLTRNTLITHVLELMGRLQGGATADSNDVTFLSNALNLMVKAWEAQGIHLWTRQTATVYLTNATSKYALNSSTGAHGSNTVAETTLSAAEASGQTVLSVTSSTGMTAADRVLIQLDDNTLHSTTIVSVDSATQITITSSLASAAASGNQVYTYTTRLGRPLSILGARLKNSSNIERPLNKLSHQEYFDITNKTTASEPTGFYYDPHITSGQLYLWPTPDDVSDRLHITYLRQIEDFDASGDDPDFPQEWLECMAYSLAARVGITFGLPSDIRQEFILIASSMLENISSWDNEPGSSYFIPA